MHSKPNHGHSVVSLPTYRRTSVIEQTVTYTSKLSEKLVDSNVHPVTFCLANKERFSERELTLYAIARPSVVCLSVCRL